MSKKWLAAGLAACMSASLVIPTTAVFAADNNRITLSDIVQAAQLMVSGIEPTEEQMEKFDLTGDGKLTVSDIVQMAKRFQAQMNPAEPTPEGSAPQATPSPAVPAPMLTPESAQSIAIGSIEGATDSAQVIKCELDSENGSAVYEVEFLYNGAHYECDVLAYSGDIIKTGWTRQPSADYQGVPMALDEAVAFVLGRIPGAAQNNVKAEFDLEGSMQVYDVEVIYGGKKYEAVLVARTGELIAWSEETYAAPGESAPTMPPVSSGTHDPSSAATASPTPAVMLSQDAALAIALGRVPGSTTADVKECKLDREDGIQVYEIELLSQGTEYSFAVNASSGQVLKESWEKHPTPGYPGLPMGRTEAAQALASAVPGASAAAVQTEYDTSDGVPVVEASLTYGGMEYDATYVRATGEMIEWSAEARYYASASSSPTQTSHPSQPPVATPAPSAAPAVPSPSVPFILSPDQAKEIALARVPGADASDIVECELDNSDGRHAYEIEIRYNGAEYEITIDAYTGQVVDFDVDHQH